MTRNLYCKPCKTETTHTRNVLNGTYDCGECFTENYTLQQVESTREQSSSRSKEIGFNLTAVMRTDKPDKKGGLFAI